MPIEKRFMKSPKLKNDIERFWSKVDKTEVCWNWTELLTNNGYGQFSIKGKAVRAHRWIFQRVFGELPKDILVCHKCDNPKCVRPDHLFAGTSQDNNIDTVKKQRYVSANAMKTHCKRGHSFDEHSRPKTNSKGGIGRFCKKCNTIRSVAGHRKRRERLKQTTR